LYAAIDAGPLAGNDLLKSMAADADLLDQGLSPVSLALSSTLWPGPMPDWAFNEWAHLERAFLDVNEDWEVWTDWYEARLKNGPADQALEVAIATIPTSTWDQGPRIVNAEIRRLLDRAGMAAPTKPDPNTSLKRRLERLSLEEIAVIGTRAALRAVPLMTFDSVLEQTFSSAFLRMLCITSLTWAAASYPTQTPNRVPLNAARRDATTRGGIVGAAAAATAAYSANKFDKIIEDVAGGINTLRSALAQADGDAAGAAFDLALSQDLKDLEGTPPGSSVSLARLELWLRGGAPVWMVRGLGGLV
jgi:hypothetical protein